MRCVAAIATLVAGLIGCETPPEDYIIVTINGRPAVRDVATLKITVSNAGSSVSQDFAVKGMTFPTTFSILPTGRTGELGIAVEAVDEGGAAIARGSTQSTVDTPAASLMLEPMDFVVNTEYAEDQSLSNYYAANGFQLSATTSGLWTAVYNANCSQPCNVFGRRFDATGKPLMSTAAAGTAGFPISARLTTSYSTPAVATANDTTITVWNNSDPLNVGTYSIQCRALDVAGAAVTAQLQISTDLLPDLVSVAPLPTGNFVATWDGKEVTDRIIRTAIIKPDCTLLGTVQIASQSAAGTLPDRSHVAANGTNILHAWVLAGAVHVRAAASTGAFTVLDAEIIPKRATEQVEFVRVAPLSNGFALAVRWALITGTSGPGKIELYRLSNTGMVMGAPTLVTSRSGTDFASSQSFGVTGRGDGAVMVVWHSCEERGDGSGCGVFGRILRPTGVPVGEEFVLATTTTNDQTGPSVVALPDGAFATAWTDKSGVAPDSSGTAVRARILYPPYDDAAGLLGARCSADLPCGANLACGSGSDGMSRCFATCTAGSPPPLCPGGGTCAAVPAGGTACLF